MRGDVCLYPYHMEAQRLPVYLTGVGGTAWQQPVCRPGGYFWHQLLICTEGSGVLETDGQVQALAAGDVFFLPAGCSHAYHGDEARWDVRWLTLDGTGMEALLTQLGLTRPVLLWKSASAFLPVYERVLAELAADRLQGPYACSALMYSMLMEIHRHLLRQGNAENRVLSAVVRLIDEAYGRDLSLTEMAQHAGVTPQHLCRVFRQTLRMRPVEYLTQRRVQAAQALIRQGELPLAEIARQTGFASPGYFSTVFRRCVGMSPGDYRRRMGA